MLDVLERCSRTDNAQALGELFLVVQKTVEPVVRRILRRGGFTSTNIEDVILETITHLYEGKLGSSGILGAGI